MVQQLPFQTTIEGRQNAAMVLAIAQLTTDLVLFVVVPNSLVALWWRTWYRSLPIDLSPSDVEQNF